MANSLFKKLVNVIRKKYGVNANVVPFGMGRVYMCAYRNWKHDPKPLLFVIGSDAFYTMGINVHYLNTWQYSLINFIKDVKHSSVLITPYVLYQILKNRYPLIPKLAYRKYFTSMLRGKKVSSGISRNEERIDTLLSLRESWIRSLNNMLRPKKILFRKNQLNQDNLRKIQENTIQAMYKRNKQKPYRDRRSVTIQYRDIERDDE